MMMKMGWGGSRLLAVYVRGASMPSRSDFHPSHNTDTHTTKRSVRLR
jgi:hypothetical protein